MGIEIERKFLVIGNSWKRNVQAVKCRQGYLCPGSGITVRVRVMGNKGYLTVKGKGNGISRHEYEYEITHQDAEEMLTDLCVKPIIEKNRYSVEHDGIIWEIDEFFGDNSGLVIAEVELEREDQVFLLPEWAGKEVTGDPKYFNASLVRYPYFQWNK